MRKRSGGINALVCSFYLAICFFGCENLVGGSMVIQKTKKDGWRITTPQMEMEIDGDTGLVKQVTSLAPSPLKMIPPVGGMHLKISAQKVPFDWLGGYREIAEDKGKGIYYIQFSPTKPVSMTLKVDSLKGVKAAQLAVDINCYDFDKPMLGPLTVRINGFTFPIVKADTIWNFAYYGSAALNAWDGFSTFPMPLRCLREGENKIELLGGDAACHVMSDSNKRPRVRLRLFQDVPAGYSDWEKAALDGSVHKTVAAVKNCRLRVKKAIIRRGKRRCEPAWILDIDAAFENAKLAEQFDLRIVYFVVGDYVESEFIFTVKKDINPAPQLKLIQDFDSGNWNQQAFDAFGYNMYPAGFKGPASFVYADSPDDNTIGSSGKIVASIPYPRGIVIRDDRFFLWGALDLGKYYTLEPDGTQCPAFSVNNRKFSKGQKVYFQCVYKFFPRPENVYADIYRWYASQTYSSNPLTSDIIKYDSPKPKTLPEGNVLNFQVYLDFIDPAGPRIDLELCKKLKMTNLWFVYWDNWEENFPTSGEWLTMHGARISAKKLKQYIADLHSKGFKVYLYCRQMLSDRATYDDRPPYKSWIAREKDGTPMLYRTRPLSTKALRKAAGGDTITWYQADFGNPDYRKWYIKGVKRCIKYYNADGVSWDMDWLDMYMRRGYSVSDPHSGIHHGLLKVQYEIYRFLKQIDPQNGVISNFGLAIPTQYYSDAIMFERGMLGQHKYMPDLVRAFRTNVVGMLYTDNYRDIMKSLSLGMSWSSETRFFLKNSKEGKRLEALKPIADFSAKTSATPLLDTDTIHFSHPSEGVSGSAWCNSRRLLVAVYRDTKSKTKNGLLSFKCLRLPFKGASSLRTTVVGPKGTVNKKSVWSLKMEGGALTCSGVLQPGEILLIQSAEDREAKTGEGKVK